MSKALNLGKKEKEKKKMKSKLASIKNATVNLNSNTDNIANQLQDYNAIEVVNVIANRRSDGYRLTPAAKRLLIMRKFQDELSARDTALLIRVLNEIDAAEDKQNGGVSGTMSFSWTDTTAKDVDKQ